VPEYSVPFVLKPAKTFCGVQSGGVRDEAVARLVEEREKFVMVIIAGRNIIEG
jgi:hypothetical protein